jgi:hypothetical protein
MIPKHWKTFFRFCGVRCARSRTSFQVPPSTSGLSGSGGGSCRRENHATSVGLEAWPSSGGFRYLTKLPSSSARAMIPVGWGKECPSTNPLGSFLPNSEVFMNRTWNGLLGEYRQFHWPYRRQGYFLERGPVGHRGQRRQIERRHKLPHEAAQLSSERLETWMKEVAGRRLVLDSKLSRNRADMPSLARSTTSCRSPTHTFLLGEYHPDVPVYKLAAQDALRS